MAGCGKSDDQKLNNGLRQAVSSVATVITVGEWWSNGIIPDAYSYRTFESMSNELGQELGEIESLPNATAEEKEMVKKIQSTVSSMSPVVRQQNKGAFIQLLNQLKSQYSALSTLINSSKE
jgi:hypothetical protein